MARTAYHVTSGTADAGYTKVVPETWTDVGAMLQVYLKVSTGKPLLVNTVTDDDPTSIPLLQSDEAALEDKGRTLYVYGGQGQQFITDDGA